MNTDQNWNTYKGLWALSLPSILASMLEPLSSVVDTALVGRFDTSLLASLAIGVTIISSLTWMFNFLVHVPIQGISQAIGEKDYDRVISFSKLSLIVAVGLSLVLIICVYPFKDSIYNFMEVEKGIRDNTDQYFSIRLLGHAFILLFTVMLSIVRGFAKVKAALFFIGVTTLSNIILSYLSLYTLGFGIKGVAIATVISNGVGFLLSFLYFLSFKEVKGMILKAPIQRDIAFSMSKNSLNIFGRSAFLTLSFFISTKIASSIGVVDLASHQIILQIWLFASFFTDGVATSGNIIGARYFKTDKHSELKGIFNKLLVMGLVVGLSFCFTYLFLGDYLLSMFTEDKLVLTTIEGIWIFISFVQIPLSVAYVYDGFLFGIGRFDFLRKHMMIAFFLIFIPIGYVAYNGKSLLYIWIAMSGVGFYRLLSNFYCIRKEVS